MIIHQFSFSWYFNITQFLFLHNTFIKRIALWYINYINKGKGKFVPVLKHHYMKIYGRVKVKVHTCLTSVLDGGNSQLHILTNILLWISYPLDRRLGEPHSWCGCSLRGKNSCSCSGSKPCHPAHNGRVIQTHNNWKHDFS